ncbi:Na-K-Cl cotransporter [Roseivirga sp. BDSF3-8]|uniref:Na-K-Cl cotransporter n=1 Tax=Roseivirga sp. BDSF3-8 TaxID=3241598 RepID=UPI003531A214
MSDQVKKLGTFGGVFTPSLLTILGVIMYLRFGWVVGNVGLIGTLIIVTLSTSITFLTALSIASIATNAPIKAGGAYFMVSRSLGVEIGGAIGIPLYLAQAFSVALYVIGFSESVVAVFPAMDIKLVGIVTTLLLGALALFSTDATIKSQYVILVVIGASLLSLVFGSPLEESQIEMWGVPAAKSEDFWKVFAIFFPAVTGIMAGVNMSGDLKNPSKSIPKGTFLAVGTGYIIYMALPLILASRADASTLIDDPLIMRRISIWGPAILLGIWGATLSSAVGSLLGAPRVLQALAIDKVLPRSLWFFRKGVGKEKIPRAGTVFTMGITLACVYLGNLDLIAPVLSMFFLTTYGVLNITAGVERFLRIPSYRPKFKVHWAFSFLGAIGCIAVMFLINPLATIAATVLIFLVFLWLKRRGLKTAWGDVRSGVLTTVIRYSILQLKKTANPKSWRPHMLVLSGAPTKRWHLIDFANALTQEKALFTVATILPEEGVSQARVSTYERQVMDYLYNKNVSALVRIIRATDPFAGGMQLINSYGLGALVPNTILLGDTREQGHHVPYARMISHIYQSRRNILIVQDDDNLGFNNKQQIDVWWGGLRGNGGLMMVLAYLLQSSPQWRHATVTIKMVVSSQEAAQNADENLSEMITNMRMSFSKKIIVQEDETFWTIMQRESAGADLVMLGLAAPKENFAEYYSRLKNNTDAIPTKVYVLAAQDIEFKEVLT